MCGVCVSILSKLRTGALLELHVGLVYFFHRWLRFYVYHDVPWAPSNITKDELP